MPELRGLENTRAVRRAYFARSASAAIEGLRKGRAMTAADDFGAIHAYKDFDGKYRCEAMRYMTTVDSQILTSLTAVRKWYAAWLKQIGERP